jgi:iron complex outermembrane receptor protein/outer membrane receptor for ferrienterochelin and colicins
MNVLDHHNDLLHQYFQNDRSGRHTGELIYEHRLKGNKRLSIKSSYSVFELRTASNSFISRGRQQNYFSEASLVIPVNSSTLVAGININGDQYHTLVPGNISLQEINNHYAGVFTQFSWHWGEKTIVEPGLRLDHHQREGLFFLPRLAIFHRINDAWATRLGYGKGYKIPNPLSPQVVDVAVEEWASNGKELAAELSTGWNAEINYRHEWNEHTDLFINQAFFQTEVHHPALLRQNTGGQYFLETATATKRTAGFDTYLQLNVDEWEAYAGYTFTSTKELLTPKQRAAFTLVHEWEEAGWRLGLEGSYTGPQKRLDLTRTPGFVFLAAMTEKKIGKHFSVILNGENLLDYRMSREESLYTGTITQPTFKPLWAPIDGLVINLSVRYR